MAGVSPGARRIGALLATWRGLAWFWAGLVVVLGIGAALLELLGPPQRHAPARPIAATPPAEHPSPAAADHPAAAADHPAAAAPPPAAPPPAAPAAARLARPGRAIPGPVADPDPSLLVPYAGDPTLMLPRISVDGRVPMAAYAGGFDPSSLRPRVALVVAGIGMSESDSLAAIKDLPESVTLAVSPYAGNIGHMLEAARMAGHEYLLSIPMEPLGYPANDPDDRHALMTSLPPSDNLLRLNWILSRLAGYVGVTSAFGQMHGERLMGVADQLDVVLEDVAHRGLLFVDCRIGHAALPYAWSRSVDLVIDDDPIDPAILDQRLDALSHMALDKGSALGLVSIPRPVTLARVAAWTNTLLAKGLALAPVSALALPPAKQELAK